MPKRSRSRSMSRTSGMYSRAMSRSPSVARFRSRSVSAISRRYGAKRSRIGSRNVHKFSRWVATPVTHLITGTEYDGAGLFQFSDLVNSSEFSNLYDRYKITHIQARVQLLTNPNSTLATNEPNPYPLTSSAGQPTNWYPKFWWVPDYDDSSTELISELKQRAKTKVFVLQPNKMYKINIKPAVLVQNYGSLVGTGYTPKWNQWIDFANLNVAHYGYKYCIDTSGIDPKNDYPFKVQIEYKYWFTCKDVR